MKRFYISIWIALSGFITAKELHAQCAVDYSTMNYFCDLDSLILSAVPIEGVPPFSFIWETGETTQSIMIPLALGDYMLTMTDANGCTAIINCHIKPFPQVLYYPYNQNACLGDTVTLFLEWFRDSIPGATYLWSTGETTPTIQLTDDIIWSVTVTDPSNGCEFEIPPGLFDFHHTPDPEIVGSNFLCNGQSITLSVDGGPFGTIVWYPAGAYQETYEVTSPGEYIVWVSSPEASYCWKQDTINITEDDITPPILDGPPELCGEQTGTITITNYALYEEFLWSNGVTTYSFTVDEPGTYSVTVTADGGCTATESITVNAGTGPELSTVASASSCGESNGSIDLTAIPPQSFEFLWSNGATTPDLNNVPAGTYSVTVTDQNGCTSVTTDVIPDIPVDITINETITPNTSCNSFNGAIDLFITPAGETYSITWSNGATTEDIEGLLPGSYSVTVTTGVNCVATGTFEVEDLSGAAEIFSNITPSSCGESNGAIEIQLSGGQGPFTYLWSNGETTDFLTDIQAGTYSITVTGSDGCVSSSTILVPEENPDINISGIVFPNTSCDGGNGEIDITVSPTNTYIFSWSNGSTSEDLISLSAGDYSVTVSLGLTCIESASFTVTNSNIPFDVTGISLPNTSCLSPNGAIDIVVSPSGSYTYTWSGGQTTEDLQGLDEGNYEVTVTDAEGCSIVSTFTIENQNINPTISGITIHNTSCQIPNGQIDIAVEPTGTYTYLWSTGDSVEDLLNIGGGTYTVTVTSNEGCTASQSFVIEDQATGFMLSGNVISNTSCTTPNGVVDLTPDPPGSYNFLWSNGATTEDLSALPGGVYSVTVTDIQACSSTASFVVLDIQDPPQITAVIQDEVCGEGNGSIDLNVMPPGSSILWSNGTTGEDLTALSAGTFSVEVTAPNGCTTSDTFQVNNTSNNFTLSGLVNNNTACLVSNGSIDLLVQPVGIYSFLWSNGDTTEDLQSLPAGQFSVTVTDADGCSSIEIFTVQDNSTPPVISASIVHATCGQDNGEVDLSVTPASGNSFLWSNGSQSEDLTQLFPGMYTVTVTDANGCSAVAQAEVLSSGSSFDVSGTITANTSCLTPNGSIELSVEPNAFYIYAWSNGSSSPVIQNIQGGIYTVTVTDELNCPVIDTFLVENDIVVPLLNLTATPATCGQNNGSVELSVTQTSNNTFLWSNGSTTEDLSGLLPGIYTVTVTSMTGCSAEAWIEVVNYNSSYSISGLTQSNTSCTLPSGSINLTIEPAGSYSFTWSNGQTTEDLFNLSAGIYEVTVSDAANCNSTERFVIEDEINLPVISDLVQLATCGENNGSIFLTAPQGANYSYIWSTGDTGSELFDIGAGNYRVTVTDLNGCTAAEEYTMPESEPLQLELDADLSGMIINGTVSCSLNLNVPIETIDTIMWEPHSQMSCNAAVCTEQTFTIEEPTMISVMAFDTNGCMGVANLLLDIGVEDRVFIPNVFSPNGDGPNDKFTVFANEEVQEVVELEIFDRWGNKVFVNESFPPNDPNYGWDGIFRGKPMDPAVFAYRAVVLLSNGDERAYKGDVTLVR